MFFKNLYDAVAREFPDAPVSADFIRKQVNLSHLGVGEIKVYAVKYPEPNRQAHFVLLGQDRSSAYDEPFDIAEIRYCEALDEDPFERRYALTKELMHVFDNEDERTDTREKFIRLLKEIQNQPLPDHASAMFTSELGTRWMAAIVLCPKHLRDKYQADYANGLIEDFELAEIFRVPEWLITYVMDEYYDTAFDTLMLKGLEA